jgi:SAM-dependent methyltransferase
MGYGRDSLNLTLSLWKDGVFDSSKSVIELGSQDLKMSKMELDLVFNKILQIQKRIDEPFIPEMMYRAMGFDKYRCVDADGQNNALVFDLNSDIRSKYSFNETFDLVTNHGTTEHCFDQYNVFRNIHNFCKPNGIMIHGLPFQGYLNHGFYNYQPAFYRALAAANNYRMIGLYLNINSEVGDLSTYSDRLMGYLHLPPNSTMLILAVMQKIGDQDFSMPFDGKYISSSLLNSNSSVFQKQPSSFFIPDQFDVIESYPSKDMLHILKKRIKGKIVRVATSFIRIFKSKKDY